MCSSMDGCGCDLHGAELAFAGMQRVVEFATKFLGFTASDSNSVEVTDGLSAVKARPDSSFDAVLVDCFGSADRVPDGCRSKEFLSNVRRILKDDGLLMQNIWAHSAASPDVEADFAETKESYAGVFQRQPLEEVVTDVPQSKEEILYGVKGRFRGDQGELCRRLPASAAGGSCHRRSSKQGGNPVRRQGQISRRPRRAMQASSSVSRWRKLSPTFLKARRKSCTASRAANGKVCLLQN